MAEKIIGYVILGIGIIIIALSAVNGFRLITKQAQPVQLFNIANSDSQIPLDFNGSKVNINSSTLLNSLGLSSPTLNFSLNLVFHLMILGFIAKMGFHLASLGTMLVRPIKVDIKAKENNA